ncbi:MAG TPA: adenylyl-sulfate kinase [Bryobacteraceae bacterium]|jgi:adenylylsulfate kinase
MLNTGFTVWMTGLSSSGKTTLAKAVAEVTASRNYRTESLDGDEMRQYLCRDLGFSKEGRDENIRRIGFVAELLTRNGIVVMVSAISPYRAAREEARKRIGRFIEVYVCAPIEICEQRDTHGIYKRARAGQLFNVAGIDQPYEAPLAPDVRCYTDRETLVESRDKILLAMEPWLLGFASVDRTTSIESSCAGLAADRR